VENGGQIKTGKPMTEERKNSIPVSLTRSEKKKLAIKTDESNVAFHKRTWCRILQLKEYKEQNMMLAM